MSNLIMFWHRRDLRITDNTGLLNARELSPQVVGLFCFDPQIIKGNDIAPVRMKYMVGCLQALQKDYQKAGSQLLILQGNPVKVIPKLAIALNAKAVFWNWDVEPYAQKRDYMAMECLRNQGIQVLEQNWDHLLSSPHDIFTGTKRPYTVYSPFWKNWNSKTKAEPVYRLDNIIGLDDAQKEIAANNGVIALPTSRDLGFVWESELILEPGETAAKEKLEKFCKKTINEYQEQRNLPSIEGTSQLSAALKFGVISIRTVWQATLKALENSCSVETKVSIHAYQQELAWREFYQHVMYHFPELAEGAYRKAFKNFPWENNTEYFQAWCKGKTGYPIIDAAMRQLNQTGWMHNRCRMIVASFLTKDLIIDSQWGEKYFMQNLIDGDLSSNNGGWQWSTSSGMDPKPLRIFNPISQTQKFDREGEYIRKWIPELQSLDPEYLVTGKISPLERHAINYPEPIVDHNHQQKRFKELYKQATDCK